MKYCFDEECLKLAKHFFGNEDKRLNDIAQDLQDVIETYPDMREIPAPKLEVDGK